MNHAPQDDDVPSPIDLRDPADAQAWVDAADRTRPWRKQIREWIAERLRVCSPLPRNVLELGSGPGLLAQAILQVCTLDRYTLFDFSQAMLNFSRARLADHQAAEFICGDFKHRDWSARVSGPFDAVVAMQAVHELRHKRHVPALYQQIRGVLRPGGLLVVCDHTPPKDGPFAQLHSTEAEQQAALEQSGFVNVASELRENGLYVFTATNTSFP